MPIDARISMGLRPQTYDAFAAYDTGRAAAQTAQANQMAMQAAQVEAELNRNAMLEAQTLDPNDRVAQQRYALRYGAAATPRLTALSGVDTNFAGRGTEARAQGKFETEQRGANYGQLVPFATQLLGDASPANVARVRGMAEASGFPVAIYDALATSLVDLPPEAQQRAIQSFLASMSDGQNALKTFFPAQELATTATGQQAVNLSPLARDPGTGARIPITGPLTTPEKYNDVSTEQGIIRVYSDGRTEALMAPDGSPLREAPPPPSPADQRASAAAVAEAAAASEKARNAANTNRTSVQNTLRVVDDILPNVSGWTAGLGSLTAVIPGTPAADLAANLDTLEANLSFERLAEMRANSPTGGALGNITVRELDLLGATIANIRNSQSPEQLRRNLQVIAGALRRLEAAYAEAGLPSPVSGGGAPPTPAPSGGGRATHRNAQGQGIYWNGSAWVPGT